MPIMDKSPHCPPSVLQNCLFFFNFAPQIKKYYMNSEVERINLEDYFQTGEGGTALTYNRKDGKSLAKLFMPSFAAETAVREFRINQVVYESGFNRRNPLWGRIRTHQSETFIYPYHITRTGQAGTSVREICQTCPADSRNSCRHKATSRHERIGGDVDRQVYQPV